MSCACICLFRACISGDEVRDGNVETDSVGIIDPKDYIEELSNPDLDAPQNEDLGEQQVLLDI